MVNISEALTTSTNGTIITIEVSTGSKSGTFPSGYNPWRKALGCQVSAQPVDGKANIAIIGLIAGVLDVSQSDVSIVSGLTSTRKKVLVRGLSAEMITSRIETKVPG
ncbi:MAG: DUF167 domain-containing protein [Methanomicrobiales archaeon]